jgi:MoxR-like ATPase
MAALVYRGTGEQHSSSVEFEPTKVSRYRRPQDYIAEPGLVNAVNVALLLDKPLLLTGEPGTGKSQLAYSLSWELGLGEPLKFETKSTSTSKDLFYTFDTVGRFKSNQGEDALPFLTYNALGRAILFANEESVVAKFLGQHVLHPGKHRSVVLIDEVDKAPRDFPNDILNELDFLRFSIPELGDGVIAAEDDFRPIMVITSNSEKDLPDAFLRRCTYYNIPFPKRDLLKNIVALRLGEFTGSKDALLVLTLDLFYDLRDSNQLRKKPATAELLDWLIALRGSGIGETPASMRMAVQNTLSSLVKTAEDQEKAKGFVDRWFSAHK